MAGAIADAIAAGLLLEPVRYVVESDIVVEDITKVYAIMLEHCDLHMGFKLIPEGYAQLDHADPRLLRDPVRLRHRRSRHSTRSPTCRPAARSARRSGTSAHIRLVSYLQALPADKRWPTFPMGTNDLALESLLNGTVDVALVWAPSLWAKQRDDPAYADLHVIDPDPLPPTIARRRRAAALRPDVPAQRRRRGDRRADRRRHDRAASSKASTSRRPPPRDA